METFLEIVKYTLPSLVVFLTAYLILKTYLDSRLKSDSVEASRKDHEITLPLRLQAYERMVLFLERISPAQLVFRVKRNEMSPAQFQNALILTIREEYEHNIAQQIYLSTEAWNLVRNAKEDIVRHINTAFIDMDEKAGANDMAQRILEEWSKQEKNAVHSAILFLKDEVGRLFFK
jgi:hypothetical protein